MAKEYHIVFGESAKNAIVQHTYIDFVRDDLEIIVLSDNLTEGPLYDVKTLEGLSKRIDWFKQYYREEPVFKFRQTDIFEIQYKLNKVLDDDKIFIWLGNEGNEYIWKCALLHFFYESNTEIYEIEWSEIAFQNINNYEISPYSVIVSSPTNILIAAKNFKLISSQQYISFSNLWVNLLDNNAELRVLNGVNSILETTIDYYDNILLSACSTNFQRSVIVVAKTFGILFNRKYYCGIWEDFLYSRLKILAVEGKLLAKNLELGNSRLIEIALKTA